MQIKTTVTQQSRPGPLPWRSKTDIHTRMLTAVLFIITKNWKEPSWDRGYVMKCVCPYCGLPLSSKIGWTVATHRDMDERSLSQKITGCMFQFVLPHSKGKQRCWKQLSGSQGWGVWEGVPVRGGERECCEADGTVLNPDYGGYMCLYKAVPRTAHQRAHYYCTIIKNTNNTLPVG